MGRSRASTRTTAHRTAAILAALGAVCLAQGCTAIAGISGLYDAPGDDAASGSDVSDVSSEATSDAADRAAADAWDAQEAAEAHDATGDAAEAGQDVTQADTPSDAGGDESVDQASEAPPPPITFVQANATNGGVASTATVDFTSAVTAQDAIIVAINYDGMMSAPMISDSSGNTYGIVASFNGMIGQLFVALAQNVAGGLDSVKVTFPGPSTSTLEVYIHEYANVRLSSASDVSTGSSGTSNAQDGMTSGLVATSYANELVFGLGITGTASPGTGFMLRSGFDGNVTEDELSGQAGLYQATATMTAGGVWDMVVATFRGQ